MEYSIAETINISSLENKIILKKEKIKTQCCQIAGIFLKDKTSFRKTAVYFKMARNVIWNIQFITEIKGLIICRFCF